jgi:hypothetical protein
MVQTEVQQGRKKPIDYPFKDPPRQRHLEYDPNYIYADKPIKGYVTLDKFQNRKCPKPEFVEPIKFYRKE